MKTSELIGTDLDIAVMRANKLDYDIARYGTITGRVNYDEDGLGWTEIYSPSTNWLQGGPIIERERIELRGDGDGGWIACDNIHPESYGPIPLVAAMRCYVTSVLGDEVDLDQLCEAII